MRLLEEHLDDAIHAALPTLIVRERREALHPRGPVRFVGGAIPSHHLGPFDRAPPSVRDRPKTTAPS